MNTRHWLGAAGALLILLVWQAVGALGLMGAGIASPVEIARRMVSDGADYYGTHVAATLAAAAQGYLWGNVVAISCAALVMTVPLLERLVLQIGIASACVPLIAIAPILSAVLDGPVIAATMAAVSVFFTTLVGTLSGLRQTDPVTEDVVRAYGGGRFMVLRKVQLLSALPSILTALRIGVPGAVLGAIVGEFMGQPRGLGAALVVSQQASDVARTWGIAIAASALAGLAFLAVNLAGRLLAPWAVPGSGEAVAR